jgi:hypothetical protein
MGRYSTTVLSHPKLLILGVFRSKITNPSRGKQFAKQKLNKYEH